MCFAFRLRLLKNLSIKILHNVNRLNIINSLLAKTKAKTYLEIGSFDGRTYENVVASYKVGIDPNPQKLFSGVVKCTSDDYFKNIDKPSKFAVIFIDGLHVRDQVNRDLSNSLEFLDDDGYIVLHDANPIKEEHQVVPFTSGHWNGDVWKSILDFRFKEPNYTCVTVDVDEGCTVITKKRIQPYCSQNLNFITETELNYKNLENNRQAWLNLITWNDFSVVILGNDLDSKLRAYIGKPDDPENNYALANHYDALGQNAPAVSFFIRTAERSNDTLLQYECILRAAYCFAKQGTRGLSVRSLLHRAIALLPKRPEAYFLLSRWFERDNTVEGWVNCYSYATMGEGVCEFNRPPLRSHVDYPGDYGLKFERAVGSWWVGLCEESRDLFIELNQDERLNPSHRQAVLNNLKFMDMFRSKHISYYTKNKSSKVKCQFEGIETIEHNYSEAYQDMFILSMLNGKRNGTYLEIGSADPFYGNNTALLEKSFGWSGVSVDFDENFVKLFKQHRDNPCVHTDALTLDYEKLLDAYQMPYSIDYLQIDIDPAENSLEVLKKIPFDVFTFKVITFEHDAYANLYPTVREEARKILHSKGYILMASDVAPDHWRNYEDWWVHPSVGSEIIDKMKRTNHKRIKAESYILNG